MNTKQLVRHARELWNSPLVPPQINRHNRKAWVRSVLRLGDKWLLANIEYEITDEIPLSF